MPVWAWCYATGNASLTFVVMLAQMFALPPPTVWMATTIAITISAMISPYSIAVAPRTLSMSLIKRRFMSNPLRIRQQAADRDARLAR